MNIISSCQMGPGTFEAKFIPLSKVKGINKIYVLRKQKGPHIHKVQYIILPKVCKIPLLNIIITPILLLYYTKKYNAKLILSYHVIPHAFFAFFASRLSGVPFSISQTGLLVQQLSHKKYIGRCILHIFRKAMYINVPGSASKKHWIEKGVAPDKIMILHSTISTDVFYNTNTRKEYEYIFLGRLAAEKNIKLLISAFGRIIEEGITSRLLIVGDGPERKNLEKHVEESKLEASIDFVGFQNDVNFWLNKSKVFVMSSTSDAMPTALMQAMACELVCVSSEVGNISDLLIHNVNGFLYNSNDIDHLTSLMKDSIENYDEYRELQISARKSVLENHSYSSAVLKWEKRLSNIVN